MGRIVNHLNTVLHGAFAVLAAALAVLGGLSLAKGPTLRFSPYIFGVCAVYYLGTAVWTFVQGGRGRVLKGFLLLLLTLFCAGMAFVTQRCVG